MNDVILEIRCVSIPAWCDWETVDLHPVAPSLQCFNSSLVRLGVDSRLANIYAQKTFQFQLGAIGR